MSFNRIPEQYNAVNHPKHYTSHPSGVECIQITEHMNFNCGNALKYLWRSGIKNAATLIEDLEKSVWYLQREIRRLKDEQVKEKELAKRMPHAIPSLGQSVGDRLGINLTP